MCENEKFWQMVREGADRTGFANQPQGQAFKTSDLLGELQPHFEPERLRSSTELLWLTDFTKLLTFYTSWPTWGFVLRLLWRVYCSLALNKRITCCRISAWPLSVVRHPLFCKFFPCFLILFHLALGATFFFPWKTGCSLQRWDGVGGVTGVVHIRSVWRSSRVNKRTKFSGNLKSWKSAGSRTSQLVFSKPWKKSLCPGREASFTPKRRLRRFSRTFVFLGCLPHPVNGEGTRIELRIWPTL